MQYFKVTLWMPVKTCHYTSVNFSVLLPLSPCSKQFGSTSSYLQCSLSNLLFPCYLLICLLPFCPSFGFLLSRFWLFCSERKLVLRAVIVHCPSSNYPFLCLLGHPTHFLSKKEEHEAKPLLSSREH